MFFEFLCPFLYSPFDVCHTPIQFGGFGGSSIARSSFRRAVQLTTSCSKPTYTILLLVCDLVCFV